MVMPFVVRLFLQNKAEIGTNQGFECSGSIIDDHWIATSYACCDQIVAFRLLNFGLRKMSKGLAKESIGYGPIEIENQSYDICLIRRDADAFLQPVQTIFFWFPYVNPS